MKRPPVSGPITVTVSEGMVIVAKRTYKDADTATRALDKRPWWLFYALSDVKRRNRASQGDTPA